MKKQIIFNNDDPLCKECWGDWVKSQCKGDVEGFERCGDFKEGCVKCLSEFCEDGVSEGLCLRLK